jgi:hypothetical protein
MNGMVETTNMPSGKSVSSGTGNSDNTLTADKEQVNPSTTWECGHEKKRSHSPI